MTKQQTIELLSQQLPGFYSLEQVIKIINDIETDPSEDVVVGLTRSQIEDLRRAIVDQIDDNADNLDSDCIDTGSAEFELHGTEISLYSADLDTREITRIMVDGIGDVIDEFFEELNKEDEQETLEIPKS